VVLGECAFIVLEDFLDFGTMARITEEAASVAFVEPVFELAGEAAVILVFGFFVPGFWVVGEPGLAFLLPLLQLRGWHGVAETESDELHDFSLLPVGEFGAVLLDVFGGIKVVAHGRLQMKRGLLVET
jgi:hypothetical protein